jgi:hypothetical protein
MALKDVRVNHFLTENGRAIARPIAQKKYATHGVQPVTEITITAGATNQVINVVDRGTIKYIALRSSDTTSLTCVWNGGDTRAIKDVLVLTDNITSLTVSNSDADNSKTLEMIIVYA